MNYSAILMDSCPPSSLRWPRSRFHSSTNFMTSPTARIINCTPRPPTDAHLPPSPPGAKGHEYRSWLWFYLVKAAPWLPRWLGVGVWGFGLRKFAIRWAQAMQYRPFSRSPPQGKIWQTSIRCVCVINVPRCRRSDWCTQRIQGTDSR